MAADHQFFQRALKSIGKARAGSEESRMKYWAILLPLLLVGCADAPLAPQRVEGVFQDQAFAPASERIDANDIFALSNEMRRYLKVEIADQLRIGGPQRG